MYGNELKRYLRNMVYLRYVFGLIRGEIEYTCAPLPEIFFGVSARVKEPYRRWLKKTAEKQKYLLTEEKAPPALEYMTGSRKWTA